MRKWLLAACAAALVAPTAAYARVVVAVDKTSQQMTVAVDGRVAHVWDVSTGRANFGTPTGVFAPQRLARTWFSSKYYNSPMPYSIFFHKGYAIHGSNEISKLGGPASHGCVRLHPRNAATLFALVSAAGPGNTRIVVEGDSARASLRRERVRDPIVTGTVWRDDDRVRPSPKFYRYRPAIVEDDGWEQWGGSPRRIWR